MLSRCRLSLVALALCTAARADVFIVAEHGAGDFDDIQPAIDHALAGDVILLWPQADFYLSPYGDLQITKGVTIVGLGEDLTRVGRMEVFGVPAGETVVLMNLVNGGPFPSQNPSVVDCEGTVLFQNCYLSSRGDGETLTIVRSRVGLVDTTLRSYYGGNGVSRTGEANGANGVRVENGHLAVWQSELHGGGGENIIVWDAAHGGKGGDGVRLDGPSQLWVQDSDVLGGWGSNMLSLPIYLSVGGDGGPALRAEPPALAYARASYVRGGRAGTGETSSGVASDPVVGELARLEGAAQNVALPAWSRDSDAPLYRFEGPALGTVSLVVADRAQWTPLGRRGVLVAGQALSGERVLLGDVPADGVLETTLALPDVEAGSAHTFFVQTVLEENGEVTVGVPRAIVAVDPRAIHTPRRLFVDSNALAGGDGESWATAFASLHTALERVPGFGTSRTEIWIREGTYRPDAPFGDPAASFHVKRGTHLYGGFEGTETSLDERSARDHPTVLSGDLGDDDGPNNANVSDNSWTVVKSAGTFEQNRDVRLDSLVLRDGQGQSAWGSALESFGELDLVDCTLVDNHGNATAWYTHAPKIRAHGSRFLGNSCTHRGGVVWVGGGGGSAEFVNCEFIGNVGGDGTAIMAQSATSVDTCTFHSNRSETGKGAAIYTEYTCPSLYVANSIFWKDYSKYGTHPDFHQGNATTVFQIDRSLFKDGGTLGFGAGNLDGPPRLVDPDGVDDTIGTADDDLRLKASSPCIDAGSNLLLPLDALDLDRDGDVSEPLPVDLFGRTRRVDDPNVTDTGEGSAPIVDMGAHERQ